MAKLKIEQDNYFMEIKEVGGRTYEYRMKLPNHVDGSPDPPEDYGTVGPEELQDLLGIWTDTCMELTERFLQQPEIH